MQLDPSQDPLQPRDPYTPIDDLGVVAAERRQNKEAYRMARSVRRRNFWRRFFKFWLRRGFSILVLAVVGYGLAVNVPKVLMMRRDYDRKSYARFVINQVGQFRLNNKNSFDVKSIKQFKESYLDNHTQTDPSTNQDYDILFDKRLTDEEVAEFGLGQIYLDFNGSCKKALEVEPEVSPAQPTEGSTVVKLLLESGQIYCLSD